MRFVRGEINIKHSPWSSSISGVCVFTLPKIMEGIKEENHERPFSWLSIILACLSLSWWNEIKQALPTHLVAPTKIQMHLEQRRIWVRPRPFAVTSPQRGGQLEGWRTQLRPNITELEQFPRTSRFRRRRPVITLHQLMSSTGHGGQVRVV